MLINLQSRRVRRAALIVFLAAVLPTLWFGLRTYGSLNLLRSAYSAGAPATSGIRAWMTLGYVASTYRTSTAALTAQLGLPADTSPDVSLRELTDRSGSSRPAYVARVQRAVAATALAPGSSNAGEASGWLGAITDRTLTALLVYGYPALGATLLLGAVGLPLPAGIVATVAGSLAAQGRLDWALAAAIAVIASLLGDSIGYGLGRWFGRSVLERHGRWFGYTPARRGHVQLLLEQWGAPTVFVTRTFLSHFSSVANLLAGMSHYRPARFLAVALAGRMVWTAAYLGLGYGIGADWQAATAFLTNLSVLIVLLALLTGSGLVAFGSLQAR